MTTFDWIALIGAGAWIPPIIVILYKLIAKPKIEIIMQPSVNFINYFGFLVVFIDCVISTEKRNALIKKIEVRLNHEKGDNRKLEWIGLTERQSKMSYTSGESVEITRERRPYAIKVLTTEISDYQLNCADLDNRNKFKTLINDVINELSTKFKDTKPVDKEEIFENTFGEIKSSKSYNDLISFLLNSLYLLQGDYKLNIRIYDTSRKRPTEFKYRFKLGHRDINILKQGYTSEKLNEAIRLELQKQFGLTNETNSIFKMAPIDILKDE